MSKMKKRVRRLEERVEDLTDAYNLVSEIVTGGMGRIEGLLLKLQGVEKMALTLAEDNDVEIHKCPVCSNSLIPKKSEDDVLVFPRHTREVGMGHGKDTVYCSGTALPVSNTDANIEGAE